MTYLLQKPPVIGGCNQEIYIGNNHIYQREQLIAGELTHHLGVGNRI